jgi:hypothetical protein
VSSDIHNKIWDLNDYSPYGESNQGTWVSCLLNLSSGMLAYCSADTCHVQLWNKSMKQPVFSKQLNPYPTYFRSNFLLESSDGYLISGDYVNGLLRRWNLTDKYNENPAVEISNGKFIMTKHKMDY